MHKEQSSSNYEKERVVITGIGLITPVGACWHESVRSILEGRSSYRSHETVQVLGGLDPSFLRGATISRMRDDLIPREVSGAPRIEALLACPIREALEALPEKLHGFIDWKVVLPRTTNSADGMLKSLATKVGRLYPASGEVCVSSNPRSEFIRRIAHAGEALLARRVEGVVVACADSLCDIGRLNELMLAGRLKDHDNPYGIIAAEAGGAVLLELESRAHRRSAPVLAAVSAWGNATEPNPWPTGKPSKAQGLTTAFHQAFEKLGDKGASVSQISSDENGERPRAIEWALTVGRIFPNPEKERYLWHPAVVTGDAGGAMSAVALSDAVLRLILNDAPADRVALCVSDDEGERHVLCLESALQPQQEPFFKAIRSRMGG
jgi:3-oxoacyl-(acyl-carrier-protein) synthase